MRALHELIRHRKRTHFILNTYSIQRRHLIIINTLKLSFFISIISFFDEKLIK